LARRLEELYAAWRQVFAEYWLSEAELRRAWEGGSLPPGPRRKLQAVLFRDREEYIRQLRTSQPQIELSIAYYSPEDRIAYFFAGEGSSESSWLHEGTHQIFCETGAAAPRIAGTFNFWAVEAAALYMESLWLRDGRGVVGGFDAERLQDARFRAFSEDFYLPLEALVKLGRDEFQRHPEIRRIYSQAAGLGHFFLDNDNPQIRRAFIRYLAAIHQGRDRSETLAQLTETDFAELDRAYREFLNVTDADLASARPPSGITRLSLGGTVVTDAGLANLDRYPHLTWLNLAGTRITDAGMSHVAQLKHLRDLYLSGTSVTDAGLGPLESLTKLEMLEIEGSRITETGWRRLKQALPDLKAAE
jgi:hypothetical protein